MVEKETDASLLATGRRANQGRSRQLCTSVIVATDAQGIRNYHQCSGEKDHTLKGWKHGCGCGQTWHQGTEGQGMVSTGPLTAVVFQ